MLAQQLNARDQFFYHQAHGHYHFPLATFGLYGVNPDGSMGAAVAVSPKNGFCLGDDVHVDASLPHSPAVKGYNGTTCTNPNTLRGISSGWGDRYDKADPGQAIDITGLPDGIYWFHSVVDPDNNFVESDKTNNVTDIKVQISGDTVTPVSPLMSQGSFVFDRSFVVDAVGPVATPAFSTSAPNELLVAFVSGFSQVTTLTSTVTGGGLTWTLAKRANAQPGGVDVWTAMAARAAHERGRHRDHELARPRHVDDGVRDQGRVRDRRDREPQRGERHSVDLADDDEGRIVGHDERQRPEHLFAAPDRRGQDDVPPVLRRDPAPGRLDGGDRRARARRRHRRVVRRHAHRRTTSGTRSRSRSSPPRASMSPRRRSAAVSADTPGPTSASVTWTTDEPATSKVEYGPAPALGPVDGIDPTLVTQHGLPINGLTPNTTYSYRVVSTDAAGNTATGDPSTFTTAPPRTTPPLVHERARRRPAGRPGDDLVDDRRTGRHARRLRHHARLRNGVAAPTRRW